MKSFFIRCQTSLVLILLVLALGVLKPQGLGMALGALLVGVLLWEYHRLVFYFDSFKVFRVCFSGLGMAGFVLAAGGEKATVFILFALIFFILSFWILAGKKLPPSHSVAGLVAQAVGAVFYIIFPVSTFVKMFLSQEKWPLPALTLALVCIGDSAAYLMGRIWKGRGWMTHISPNKTQAGFWTGTVSCGLVAVLIFFSVMFGFLGKGEPLWLAAFWWKVFAGGGICFLLGAFCFFISQTGDLFVSTLKRGAGVKNTGCLLPGHGGFLDRLDGFLLVWLFVYVTSGSFVMWWFFIFTSFRG